MRRLLLQAHRWVGLIAGVYVLVMSITGAALVFRIDLQRASHPHLFTAAGGVVADPEAIMDSVSRAYPDHRLSGVDAPTSARPTYLAYVTSSSGFRTILIDPVTARVLGELPERTAVRALQDLHYDLLSGRTGRLVNGIGAIAIVWLAVTGVIAWWPHRRQWRRAVAIDTGASGWRRILDLHRAAGIWSAALILMWASTGAYFAFPGAFRAIIGAVSPLTVNRTPQSGRSNGAAPPSWREVIDAARQRHPSRHVARVVLPFGERGSWLVMFAGRRPTPAYTELDSVYVDQYSATVIETDWQPVSAGDRLVRAMAPLHVGSFGGAPVRLAWFIFGLAPAWLALTGALVFRRRRSNGGTR
jgi:uncharacterized iron-regulated membrane protein